MATTTAKNRKDVENMSAQDRIWDRLSYSYGQKTDESNKAYDQAISQADTSLLRRGMQRSSYGAQTLANLRNQKVKAANDINSEKIAMYEDKLGQLEEQEAARAFQTSEREAQQAWQSGENALNRAFTTSEREASQGYSTREREASQAYNTSERLGQQAYQSGENALNRAFQTSEREAQQGWQSGENALNRAQDQAQFEANLGFQRERAAVSDSQWERQFNAANDQWKAEFDYNKMSDDQKLAYNYVTAIIGQGGTPSDDLLARAGLSRADANAMTAQVAAGGGGYGGGSGNPGSNPGSNPGGLTEEDLAAMAIKNTANASFNTFASGVLNTAKTSTTSNNKNVLYDGTGYDLTANSAREEQLAQRKSKK